MTSCRLYSVFSFAKSGNPSCSAFLGTATSTIASQLRLCRSQEPGAGLCISTQLSCISGSEQSCSLSIFLPPCHHKPKYRLCTCLKKCSKIFWNPTLFSVPASHIINYSFIYFCDSPFECILKCIF